MSKIIKSETVYRVYHLPGEDIDTDQDFEQIQDYREFDRNGNLILEIAYTHEGEIADKMEYHHDDEGKLLETFIYGEDDEILERKELIWKDNGNVGQEIIHYLDGSADIHEFHYDDKGNLTGITSKDDEDEVEFTERYTYDSDNVVKVERENGDGELIFSQEDEYNNGVIVSRKIWSAEEEEPFTIVHHFNDAGRRGEELRYDSDDQLIERNTYEEDDQGRLIRMTEENRQRKNTTEYGYDEKGNIIRQVESDLNGDLNHEVTRIYDDEGELLKTTVEVVMKPGTARQAYSLIFRRELYDN